MMNMTIMQTTGCILLGIVLAWNLLPLLWVACLPRVPWAHKRRAMVSLTGAAFKGTFVLVPNLLAPLVVPVALLFTRREADRLPALFAWWDNDVSINGDLPAYWTLDYAGDTYYAPGHGPRSFVARFVWLGSRNRASALAVRLGHTWAPGEYADAEHWGDPATGRDHAGWTLNRRGPVYQLYAVKRLGRLCLRTNVGHKVWAGSGGDARATAMVVNIALSLISWEGSD